MLPAWPNEPWMQPVIPRCFVTYEAASARRSEQQNVTRMTSDTLPAVYLYLGLLVGHQHASEWGLEGPRTFYARNP